MKWFSAPAVTPIEAATVASATAGAVVTDVAVAAATGAAKAKYYRI